MFGIGMGELILILIVGLIVFGPKNLPEVGKALGKGLREFRKAQAVLSATLEEAAAEPAKKPETPVAEKKSEPVAAETSQMSVDDIIHAANKNPMPTAEPKAEISLEKKSEV